MKPARILIIEDEAVTVALLRRELADLGYQFVGSAMNAQEAVLAAEEYRPDLVLMDITLADEYDGVLAATAIRGNLNLPVVFLTAHADEATIERAMLAGPFGYVIKPFTSPELRAAIEVALHKHQTEAGRIIEDV
jgi:CheY-like chemotaxis protein